MSTSVTAPQGASFVDTDIQSGPVGKRVVIGNAPILRFDTLEALGAHFGPDAVAIANLGLRNFYQKLAARSLTARTVKNKKGESRVIPAKSSDEIANLQLSWRPGVTGNATAASRIRKVTKADPTLAAQAAGLLERLASMSAEDRAALLASVQG